MTLATWFGFLLAAILVAVTPGPGAAVSMSIGLRHGYRAALTGILGLQTAILIHLGIVFVGFGALLATSETAFALVKFVGAGYLIWLGIEKWRAPSLAIDQDVVAMPRKGFFAQGILVNLTNPKAIVFVAALVPQFVDPSIPQVPQYLLIALTLCLTDTVVMSTYALTASRLGRWLHDGNTIQMQNRFFGGVFVTAGALLAFASKPA